MNETKKIILFNGPPSSGKDHSAKYAANNFPGVRVDKFARILKERTHALYGYPKRAWDYYESVKDEPSQDFFGLTPREAYIGVSEKYFKPMHDEKIFGNLLLRSLKYGDFPEWNVLAISDSGFVPEAEVLIEEYGAENVFLIRVHREGYNFSGDSRSYIDLGSNIHTIDIFNDGTIHYSVQLQDILNSIINPIELIELPAAEIMATLPTPMPSFRNSHSAQVDQAELDAKAPVDDFTTIYKGPKPDFTEEGEDYIFIDIVEQRPWYKRLWARLTK